MPSGSVESLQTFLANCEEMKSGVMVGRSKSTLRRFDRRSRTWRKELFTGVVQGSDSAVAFRVDFRSMKNRVNAFSI
jgi:hypothetical protein